MGLISRVSSRTYRFFKNHFDQLTTLTIWLGITLAGGIRWAGETISILHQWVVIILVEIISMVVVISTMATLTKETIGTLATIGPGIMAITKEAMAVEEEEIIGKARKNLNGKLKKKLKKLMINQVV